MANELQSLLERIQKDGVEKAHKEAETILAAAREKAAAVMADAEAKAKTARDGAESDARAFEERSRKAVEQAARDVILSVGETLTGLMRRIVEKDVTAALTDAVLGEMLVAVVQAYAARADGAPVEALVTPGQKQKITDLFLQRLGSTLRGGVEVRGDDTIVSGFRVIAGRGKVEHTFTAEAIAEALSQLLRPALAEIVRAAQAGMAETNKR